MNNCPYANESATCDLPPVEGDQDGKQAPTIAYCKQCSQVVFRCTSGHWNRAFARYCTQCSKKLEKPAQWDMASANAQRTATLPQTPSDSLNQNYGFGSGVVDTPEIETDEDLPGLLAFDGLIVIPNSSENRFDAYTIANPLDRRSLSLKWSIHFNGKLTYGSTPIYHGLHLFYVVSGSILWKPVLGGEAEPIEINHVDAALIEPVPKSAPLKCNVNGSPTLIVGLEQGILLFDLIKNEGNYIQHKFFSENTVMSPAQCGEYTIFTALQGQIFTLNMNMIGDEKTQPRIYRDISFSAPVSLGGRVYIEALSDSGRRSLACFDPRLCKLSKVTDMDNEPENHLEMRRSLFIHPPLTDGKQLFLSDRSGKIVYTYDSESGFLSEKKLSRNDSRQMFVPHKSVVVSNKIYSAHSYGLTVLELGLNHNVQDRSLAMGKPNSPSPIDRPIRYGDKLFILCKDRLVYLDC